MPARRPLPAITRRTLLAGSLAAAGAGLVGAGRAHALAGTTVDDVTWVSSRESVATISTWAVSRPVKIRTLMPSSYPSHPRRKYPVIYLLHGSGGDHSDWVTSGQARETQADHEVIIVMPDGGKGGWYTDHPYSGVGTVDWERFHTDVLVHLVDERLPTLPWPSARAVAGYSMGGYGAAIYGGHHPDVFGPVGCYSGATDSYEMAWRESMRWAPTEDGEQAGAIYGTEVGKEDNGELWKRNPSSYAAAFKGRRVRLYAGNGTDTEATIRRSSKVFYDALVAARVTTAGWVDLEGNHSWSLAATAFRMDLPGLVAAMPRAFGG